MGMVRIWNTKSTNYNANSFVRENGTDSFEIDSEARAMRMLREAILSKDFERFELDLVGGRISWVRTHPDKKPQCNCGEQGCPGCAFGDYCCPGRLDDLEVSEQDTEDDVDLD